VQEGLIAMWDVQSGEIDEIAMVGSGIGVCPVRAVEDIGLACPGPRTALLMQDWAAATA
jgi:branched-subunit amino acid aminotransferase/4-amino-4-deoxychorismate lyase